MLTEPRVITKELSRQLSVMGFVCTVLVVMIHSTPCPPSGSWQWWIAALLGGDGLGRVAVPYFFLAAGFLLAGHFNEEGWYKREVLKRVHSLVVPYFIWIVIGLAVNLVWFAGIRLTGYACGFKDPLYGPLWQWIIDLLGLNPFRNVGILWFVRDLFVLVLLSPLIWKIIRKTGLLLPLSSFGVLLILGWMTPTMNHDTFHFFEYFCSIRGLCYFGLGIFLRFMDYELRNQWEWVACAALALVSRAWCDLRHIAPLAALFDVLMVPFCFTLVWRVRNIALPKALTSNSFPIFLMHGTMLIISLVAIVALGLHRQMGSSLALAAVRVLFAVGLSIVISSVLRKVAPKASARIFGGR